jgi:uncharacterized repeat protein (TIGR01451 family)
VIMKKLGAFLLCATFSLFLTAVTATAQAPVPLGTAAPFAVLAGSGITNTGPTTITGDVGSHPILTQTGFGSVTLIGGTNHAGDGLTQGAKTDLITAYDNAAGRIPATVATELGGQTLVAGAYNSAAGTFGITGILTLDGENNANAVFIFEAASTLITAAGAPGFPASQVVFIRGAQACNVFWQVGSSATLGTYSAFQGSILALTSITLTTGATVNGRVLARNGAVTLDTNTITTSGCAAAPAPTPTPPPISFPSDLTIAKSHTGSFQLGGTGSYTLAASNVGSGPTTGTVTVTDTLPAGLTATAISGTGWFCTLATGICWRNDSIAPGASYPPITLTVNVASDAPATVINTATISGYYERSVLNNTATDTTTITQTPAPPPVVTAVPDLTITKSHTGSFQQGGTGSYTLRVNNIGPGPTSGTVTVSDTLPAGLTATAISGTGWSCTLASRTCTRSDALAAGATYPPVTVTVNVANNLLIGSFAGDGPTFQPGDILLSMQDGTVQWRRSDWTLVKIITSVSDGHAKGMALDASGNLFLTHYFGTGLSGNSVVKFDRNGNLIGLFGSGYDCNPSAIVFDNTGNAYVGHADCSGDIFKLDSHGTRLARYDVAVENRGASHILLDPDQCTMYYTSQGRNVKRFNVCTNRQMSDFNLSPLPEAIDGAHQMARLPGGGLLVADFSVIALLDASGNLVRTYDAPADTHCWLGTVLDPDGTSFWATNWCGSSATRFDMATGNVIESHVAASPGFMVKQIIVVPPARSTVVINTAAVSGGAEVNISNNSASDSTTITTQPQAPVFSIGSTAYCVGAAWSSGVSNARPDASVRLIGTTNGQSWVVADWVTTDANGSFSAGGMFAEGTQGSYTLRVGIDGKISNTIYFVISNCGP